MDRAGHQVAQHDTDSDDVGRHAEGSQPPQPAQGAGGCRRHRNEHDAQGDFPVAILGGLHLGAQHRRPQSDEGADDGQTDEAEQVERLVGHQ